VADPSTPPLIAAKERKEHKKKPGMEANGREEEETDEPRMDADLRGWGRLLERCLASPFAKATEDKWEADGRKLLNSRKKGTKSAEEKKRQTADLGG
jgi:hypothetical protein